MVRSYWVNCCDISLQAKIPQTTSVGCSRTGCSKTNCPKRLHRWKSAKNTDAKTYTNAKYQQQRIPLPHSNNIGSMHHPSAFWFLSLSPLAALVIPPAPSKRLNKLTDKPVMLVLPFLICRKQIPLLYANFFPIIYFSKWPRDQKWSNLVRCLHSCTSRHLQHLIFKSWLPLAAPTVANSSVLVQLRVQCILWVLTSNSWTLQELIFISSRKQDHTNSNGRFWYNTIVYGLQ